MSSKLINNDQGLSLLEVLVAMLFLAGAMVGLSAFLPYGRGVISRASSDRLAVVFAEEQLEKMTAAGFNSPDLNSTVWSSATIDTHGTPSAADDLIGQYKLEVTPIYSGNLKQVTVTLWYPINRNSNGINTIKQVSQKEVKLAKFIGQ